VEKSLLLLVAGGFFVWELDVVGYRWARAFDIYKKFEGFNKLGSSFYALPEGLCALRELYARSGSFMRVQGALCAFKELYARSGNFMRAHLLRQGR
jgi:hypothetical protein